MPVIIAKETPHMFMWFSNGSKIPLGISPLPKNERLDYIKRLKEECAKLLLTNTPAYLVYMGRLLTRDQIILLENLQNDIPNLAVIDYDDVERTISDQQIISKVAAIANAYQEHEKLDVGQGGIADLVDFTRLVLLYNSKTLREIAQKKIKISLEWREGLIYRDFDVTLKKETMADIPTSNGYMATLNFLAKVHEQHNRLIQEACGDENLKKKINIFFNTYIYDLERYQQIIPLFVKRALNDAEKTQKEMVILEYNRIDNVTNFKHIYIDQIFIENSFLAINGDQHPLIHSMVQGVVQGNSPYAVVYFHFGQAYKSRLAFLNEFLTPQLIGFNVGNDLTWKMSIGEQHLTTVPSQLHGATSTDEPIPLALSVTDTTPSPSPTANNKSKNELKDQETVNKLSTLSNNYLAHLKKKPNQESFKDKYELMLRLIDSLNDPSKHPSDKLDTFHQQLEEVNKGILKEHREPKWVIFKKAALFLLGITVVGAFVGLVDYSYRRHHSIFCATKSHGERFVLDVEESISRANHTL